MSLRSLLVAGAQTINVGTDDSSLAAVAFGATVLGGVALSCACGSGPGGGASPDAGAAPGSGAGSSGAGSPGAGSPGAAAAAAATPQKKQRRRPAALDTATPGQNGHGAPGTPRQQNAEVAAELLGRRQQVLDELVAVDEACERKLRALDQHFVGAHGLSPNFRLPQHAVPAAFSTLHALPNADRAALPAQARCSRC